MVDRNQVVKPDGDPLPPPRTAEEAELQMTNLAFNLAKKQMEAGTVSAQVLTHFLKFGSENSRLEREQLRHKNLLLEAQAAQYGKNDEMAEIVRDAYAAFRGYSSGSHGEEEEILEIL